MTSLGAFHCGIDKVDVKGITSRGVLLDMVRLRGVETYCADVGEPITPAELDDSRRGRRASPSPPATSFWSDTGWWARFLQTGDGAEPGAGLDWTCASWLHDHEVAAVAADNLMVENPVSGVDGTILPMHMLCLRDMGMMFGEYWNLTAPGRGLRRRRQLRVPARRPTAERDRWRRIPTQPHRDQVSLPMTSLVSPTKTHP